MASAPGKRSEKTPESRNTSSGGQARSIAKNSSDSMGTASEEQFKCAQESALAFLIEGEIIPRLMFAHSSESQPLIASNQNAALEINPSEAARFAPLPLVADADELMQEVQAYIDRGVTTESIFVDLLAPSARRLGQLWESDTCDFLDVTMGLWRLQEVMREIARMTPGNLDGRQSPPSAVFSPLPGETHSFGALMVEEVFARAGWKSEVLLEPRRRELLRVVADNSFDLVGLTVSCDCLSGDLSDLITAIKTVSKSPKTKVIIGGRMVNAHPELVEQCGADGTATDAISALALAERILKETQLRASSTA